ncbi:HipA family toxin-antitoxin system [Gloeobacter kilaueensis JS1]|uniref:HipA family toxin-antitoxin system n=1 Tax=Gloeobacter kilaueensis (strain ATCC BAA-2537 / CCAP 1431/1 / ULC 316 / JS1) TaxID=1183438 RepID=U5QE60_GLOK1|nr:HipA family toxin-antitoxin system [Gloeobacter kilaueensis JS1]
MSNNRLEVWIDADFIDKTTRIGTLFHDRGNIRFNYDRDWLKHPSKFD